MQGFDDQVIYRQPYRTTPVRITTEQAAFGFSRLVGDTVYLSVYMKLVWLSGMLARHRPNSIIRQETCLIQHALQQTLHAVTAQQRQQHALVLSRFAPAGYQAGKIRPVVEKPAQSRDEVRSEGGIAVIENFAEQCRVRLPGTGEIPFI